MDLAIAHISFLNFRSYEAFDLDGIGPLTVLVGPNAAGKTNVVEGIGLLTAQSSFRHAPVDQLVRAGAPFARLTADVTDGSRQLELAVQMAEGKKKHLLNGKPKRTADLKGLVPSVTFTPDDLELAKGAMSVRRAALDALGSQLSANHYLIRRDYEKVLRPQEPPAEGRGAGCAGGGDERDAGHVRRAAFVLPRRAVREAGGFDGVVLR